VVFGAATERPLAERPRLEAVLLDAGGTLVRLDFEWMADEVTRLGFALDPARLRRAEVAGRRRYDASRGPRTNPDAAGSPLGGKGDNRAYFAACSRPPGFRRRWSARRSSASSRASRARAVDPADGGARAALDALGELGLRRAVVSNSDGRAELHLRDCDVLRGSSSWSTRTGRVREADPAIFRLALERMGVAPALALFVGDIRSVDEAGARAAACRSCCSTARRLRRRRGGGDLGDGAAAGLDRRALRAARGAPGRDAVLRTCGGEP